MVAGVFSGVGGAVGLGDVAFDSAQATARPLAERSRSQVGQSLQCLQCFLNNPNPLLLRLVQ